MATEEALVLAIVTSELGVLFVHRYEQLPPVMFPGTRAEPRERPGSAAERGALDDARLRVRAGRVLGRENQSDGRGPIVYVAARPLGAVTQDGEGMSLHVGWYVLDQVDMLLPDLWGPIRKHLAGSIPHRWARPEPSGD